MLRHIIFDLGNVLVNIHPQKAMRKFKERCGLSDAELKAFYLSETHLGFMAGKFSPDEFYKIMMKMFPCDTPIAEYIEIWDTVIGEPKPGIDEIIDQLTSNYELSICSNTDPWHWQVALQKCPFLGSFKRYFLSYELKMNKPNPKVFEAVLRDLGASGKECVFIDDTAENIQTASEFGINGILASEPQQIRSELINLGVLYR